jgi:hypothetical protein
MLPALGKLLILQECDHKVLRLQAELAAIEPQHQALRARSEAAQAEVETLRLKLRKLETERKELELDVQGKRQHIERYSLQQFQTRKNEEYRALSHEIEGLQGEIVRIEDHELELMEEAEATQKAVAEAARSAEQVKRETSRQLTDLAEREANLKEHLASLVQSRNELAGAVEGDLLQRYERLRKAKGERVLVGVEHGVCGGCHVKVTSQVLVHCQADVEAHSCPNCGRILYYTRDMDLTAAE